MISLEETKSIEKKERVGIAIGIITRGWVSIKWMMHLYEGFSRVIPVGMFWKFIIANQSIVYLSSSFLNLLLVLLLLNHKKKIPNTHTKIAPAISNAPASIILCCPPF